MPEKKIYLSEEKGSRIFEESCEDAQTIIRGRGYWDSLSEINDQSYYVMAFAQFDDYVSRQTIEMIGTDDIEEQRFARPHRNGVADDPHLAAIPAGRPRDGVGVAIEMQVVKRQRLDPPVVQMFFHRRADFGQIIFVNHLVGFEVKRPVAGAVEERNGFLLAIDESFDTVMALNPLVPLRREDADFGIADGAQKFFRVVITRAERHDEFIHDRQNGADGCDELITELLSIAQKSESADFHARRLPQHRFKGSGKFMRHCQSKPPAGVGSIPDAGRIGAACYRPSPPG